MRHFLRLAVLTVLFCGGIAGQFHFPGSSGVSSTKTKAPKKVKAAEPQPTIAAPEGAQVPFDYYVLSISWQTGRVLVAGFRPRRNAGPERDACHSVKAPSKGVIGIAQPLMASADAARDEWVQHGSCTGLTAVEYFNTLRFARSLVQIPVQRTSPEEGSVTENPAQIEAEFATANPGFPAEAFRASTSGVEICFEPQLKPRGCPTGSK